MSDSDYSSNLQIGDLQASGLLSGALSLGGVVNPLSCWINHALTTGEIVTASAEVSFPKDTARGDVTLSKSHIRPQKKNLRCKTQKKPFLMWRSGASFLKASQGSTGAQGGGGKKKAIKGFSANSRRGLMFAISGVRRDADLPCFVTLTYPSVFPDPKSSKRHLKMFNQRLLRAFPNASGIWKLEPQDRGAPHYHLLVWGVDDVELKQFVPYAWHDIAGNKDDRHLLFHLGVLHDSKPCVSLVRSFRGVWAYASKYLGKTFSVAGWDDLHTGRFWGYVNKEKIPFGELQECEYSSSFIYHVMRYQRRFSKRRLRASGFTLFCDSQQWVNNLLSEVQR